MPQFSMHSLYSCLFFSILCFKIFDHSIQLYYKSIFKNCCYLTLCFLFPFFALFPLSLCLFFPNFFSMGSSSLLLFLSSSSPLSQFFLSSPYIIYLIFPGVPSFFTLSFCLVLFFLFSFSLCFSACPPLFFFYSFLSCYVSYFHPPFSSPCPHNFYAFLFCLLFTFSTMSVLSSFLILSFAPFNPFSIFGSSSFPHIFFLLFCISSLSFIPFFMLSSFFLSISINIIYFHLSLHLFFFFPSLPLSTSCSSAFLTVFITKGCSGKKCCNFF